MFGVDPIIIILCVLEITKIILSPFPILPPSLPLSLSSLC